MVIKVQRGHGTKDKWWFNQQGAQDEMLLTLYSPADAIIGEYNLSVLVMSQDGHILEKIDKIKFHLLFNPWCKGKQDSYSHFNVMLIFYLQLSVTIT